MVKVLVVDDSSFFRRRISEFLSMDPDIEVIGQAVDGLDAIEKVNKLDPDLITMDIEMPRLDGISAVKKIRESKDTPILMFSSLTHAGAKATFEALDAGASDFLPKKFEDIAEEKQEAVKKLSNNKNSGITQSNISSQRKRLSTCCHRCIDGRTYCNRKSFENITRIFSITYFIDSAYASQFYQRLC